MCIDVDDTNVGDQKIISKKNPLKKLITKSEIERVKIEKKIAHNRRFVKT